MNYCYVRLVILQTSTLYQCTNYHVAFIHCPINPASWVFNCFPKNSEFDNFLIRCRIEVIQALLESKWRDLRFDTGFEKKSKILFLRIFFILWITSLGITTLYYLGTFNFLFLGYQRKKAHLHSLLITYFVKVLKIFEVHSKGIRGHNYLNATISLNLLGDFAKLELFGWEFLKQLHENGVTLKWKVSYRIFALPGKPPSK